MNRPIPIFAERKNIPGPSSASILKYTKSNLSSSSSSSNSSSTSSTSSSDSDSSDEGQKPPSSPSKKLKHDPLQEKTKPNPTPEKFKIDEKTKLPSGVVYNLNPVEPGCKPKKKYKPRVPKALKPPVEPKRKVAVYKNQVRVSGNTSPPQIYTLSGLVKPPRPAPSPLTPASINKRLYSALRTPSPSPERDLSQSYTQTESHRKHTKVDCGIDVRKRTSKLIKRAEFPRNVELEYLYDHATLFRTLDYRRSWFACAAYTQLTADVLRKRDQRREIDREYPDPKHDQCLEGEGVYDDHIVQQLGSNAEVQLVPPQKPGVFVKKLSSGAYKCVGKTSGRVWMVPRIEVTLPKFDEGLIQEILSAPKTISSTHPFCKALSTAVVNFDLKEQKRREVLESPPDSSDSDVPEFEYTRLPPPPPLSFMNETPIERALRMAKMKFRGNGWEFMQSAKDKLGKKKLSKPRKADLKRAKKSEHVQPASSSKPDTNKKVSANPQLPKDLKSKASGSSRKLVEIIKRPPASKPETREKVSANPNFLSTGIPISQLTNKKAEAEDSRLQLFEIIKRPPASKPETSENVSANPQILKNNKPESEQTFLKEKTVHFSPDLDGIFKKPSAPPPRPATSAKVSASPNFPSSGKSVSHLTNKMAEAEDSQLVETIRPDQLIDEADDDFLEMCVTEDQSWLEGL